MTTLKPQSKELTAAILDHEKPTQLDLANALLWKLNQSLTALDQCGDVGAAVCEEVEMLDAYFLDLNDQEKK